MDRHDELILLQTVPVVSRTSTNYFSKEKTCTLHEKASLMIIRLTHLKTLKAFQLKFYQPFALKKRRIFLKIQDLKQNIEFSAYSLRSNIYVLFQSFLHPMHCDGRGRD